MTREEAINQINDIKIELAEHLLKKDIEALDMAISTLSDNKGEPYDDWNSRAKLLDSIEPNCLISWGILALGDKNMKRVQPISESDNKGEWIDNGNGSYTCSNCKTEWTTSQIEKMRFCPTCGNPKVRGDKAE